MIKAEFKWDRDDNTGLYGWRLKGHPEFDAAGGLGVAHDTLEHFNHSGEHGLNDEWLAFGSILWIRAQGDWWNMVGSFQPDPAHQMSTDIAQFMGNHYWDPDGHYLRNPGRTYRIDSYMEDVIDSAFTKAKREMRDRLEQGEEIPGHKWEWTRGWMRRGFRMAQRRWGRHDPYQVSYLFQRLADEVDERHTHAEEGELLTVRVNVKQLEFKLERSYPEDRYY